MVGNIKGSICNCGLNHRAIGSLKNDSDSFPK
jgi:hypothetical protein